VLRPSSVDPVELVRPSESGVPEAVVRTHLFLQGLGLWHLFSRNHIAKSCRDAAQKRYRLGHVGISLCDEMKSYLGRYEGQHCSQFVAIHTRADRQLQIDRVSQALGGSGVLRRLEGEELERIGMAYGLVNPFRPYVLDWQAIELPLIQLFDRDLLARGKWPGTVMTNAGDFTWAVEFDATALHGALLAKSSSGEVLSGDFSEAEVDAPPRLGNAVTVGDRPEPRGRGGKITIITGNAPESGLRLAELLFERVRQSLGNHAHGDVSMPAVDIVCLPGMGMSMELDAREEQVWGMLRDAIRKVADNGTETLAIACNTSQYFGPRIRDVLDRASTRCEFVSLAEVTGAWLRRSCIERVGLIGIRFVAEMGKWSAFAEALRGVEVERPEPGLLEEIANLAYRVKTEGVTAAGITRLRDLLRKSVECNNVVLALTELSLLIGHLRQRGRSGKNLIDPLEIYADALARRFVWGDDIRA
jgi:aspartate/glutamate racemase